MPPRKVDERKTRRVLRKLERARAEAEVRGEKALTAWEREFAQSVEARLEKYGSAFRDGSKGSLDEPLSARQAAKVSEIVKAAKGKRRPLKRAAPIKPKPEARRRQTKWTPRIRQIEDE